MCSRRRPESVHLESVCGSFNEDPVSLPDLHSASQVRAAQLQLVAQLVQVPRILLLEAVDDSSQIRRHCERSSPLFKLQLKVHRATLWNPVQAATALHLLVVLVELFQLVAYGVR